MAMPSMSRIALLWALMPVALSGMGAAGHAGDFQPSDILGCWRHDIASLGGMHAFSSHCFRKDGTTSGASMGYGHGSDNSYRWKLDGRVLLMDDRKCLILPTSTDTTLLLAGCEHMGVYLRQCRELSEDQMSCRRDAATAGR
jgi:hypothetical protein